MASLQLSDATVGKIKKASVYIRVVFVDGKEGSGSGFFIAGRGNVVTNSHVIGPGARSIEVVVESGTPRARAYPATVLADDPVRDLALLQIPLAKPPESLVIGDTAGLRETHEVYIFGFPLGEMLGTEISVNRSTVSSMRKSGGAPEIQMSGGVQPGNSGGPVVDRSGKVVGVVVSKIRNTEIDFAIPAETVKDFLARAQR